MKQWKCLSLSVDNKVATVTLNRPEKANAINAHMWTELGTCFRYLDEHDESRVVIIAGEGKHFTAGIDFSLMQETIAQVSQQSEGRKQEKLRQLIHELQNAFTAIEQCRKPVIAAIDGSCIGAGVDMIAACDMRYATTHAVFAIKEVDLGITADVGTLQRLPHILPQGVIRELAYTARPINGEEAAHLGLVNAVFNSRESMMSEIQQVANKIANKSPLAIRGTKHILNYSRDHSIQDSLDYVALWNSSMLLSIDTQKAVMALMSKEPVEYEN